jgi:hypothetical protein
MSSRPQFVSLSAETGAFRFPPTKAAGPMSGGLFSCSKRSGLQNFGRLFGSIRFFSLEIIAQRAETDSMSAPVLTSRIEVEA